jgi:hypothetical protein
LTSERTIGERRFEAYLNAMGYPFEFEKEYPGKQKRPDYTVAKNGTFLFDVKDADPNMPPGFNQFDPHEAIIQRINAGRKKFKEFKEFSCCVVLQNNGNVFMNIEHPVSVLGAMYGKVGFKVPIFVGIGVPSEPPLPPPQPQQAFLGGAQFLANKNTTISALISLRQVAIGKRRLRKIREDNPELHFEYAFEMAIERFGPDFFDEFQQGVIVWENIHARVPLPRELFDGPFDERWGLDGGDVACIFCGRELAGLPD